VQSEGAVARGVWQPRGNEMKIIFRRVNTERPPRDTRFSSVPVSLNHQQNQTMPIAHLPSGVYLYYTDSGAPKATEYDTIVIVHGVAYNAGTPR